MATSNNNNKINLITNRTSLVHNKIVNTAFHRVHRLLKNVCLQILPCRRMAFLSSSTELYCLLLAYTRHTGIAQTFSVGLQSGDLAGHSSNSMRHWLNHAFVALILWMDALSCCYMRGMRRERLRYGSRRFSSTWMYSALCIRAVVKVICSVPNDENAPNTMQVPPPKLCLEKKHGSFLRSFQ
jgi:hypothetical protein